MSRDFKIVRKQLGHSRLTVTPTRITLKLRPGLTSKEETKLIKFATEIAKSLTGRRAFRGNFSKTGNYIRLCSTVDTHVFRRE